MTNDHYAEQLLIDMSRAQRLALALPADTGERYDAEGNICRDTCNAIPDSRYLLCADRLTTVWKNITRTRAAPHYFVDTCHRLCDKGSSTKELTR